MLAVSDRPFLDVDPGQPVLEAVAEGNFVARGSWQFALDVPVGDHESPVGGDVDQKPPFDKEAPYT